MTSWTPDSWRSHPIQQQPRYDDPVAVEGALDTVRQLPPLVAAGEVDALRERLARASEGRAFVLQGGDCAESFADCTGAPIEARLKILLQMSLVLTWGARMPVVRVGRMAGQYAKPRSSDTEIVDGVEMASYRGDHVNGVEADVEARRPDPQRLVRAYFHSAATMNYARALLDGGFADLNHPQAWDLRFVRNASRRAQYEEMVARILDALEFVQAVGVHELEPLRTVELFSSHEALLLAYEQAHTVEVGGRWYNLGAHMLWIGNRTRQLDGAHIEYARGIENPIGIKVGPGLSGDDLIALLDRVEPTNRAGRVTLISRFGAEKIRAGLPPLIERVQAEGRDVVWSCDPMHGNTTKTASGRKTRNVNAIMDELAGAFDTHDAAGSTLAGVHFELTGEDVTECIGGPQELREDDLERSYQTLVDPRLNYAQSLELAFRIALRLQQRRAG